jgi:hypothetical protein
VDAIDATHRAVVVINAPFFIIAAVCRDASGNELWRDGFTNLVTTAGKNDVLDKYFKGTDYTASWCLGLKGAGTASASDTLASHAGWSEIADYAGGRPSITFGTSAAGSNAATAITYTFNADVVVAGAFVTDQGTGSSGLLYSAGDFAASHTIASASTLTVTLTVQA